MAELSVRLVADLEQFLRDLKKAEGGLEDFGKKADQAGDQSDDLEGTLTDLASGFALSAVGATTLTTFLIIAASELYRVATAASAAELSMLAFNTAIGKAKSATIGETIKLETLVGIAQDVTQSYETRQRALEALQRIYPKVLSNVDLETIGTRESREQLDLLNKEIVRNAQLKSISSAISEQQNIINKEENKTAWERIDIWDAFWKNLTNFNRPEIVLDSETRTIKDATSVIKDLRKEAEGLIETGVKIDLPEIDPEKTTKGKKVKIPWTFVKYKDPLDDLLNLLPERGAFIPEGTFGIVDAAQEELNNALPTYEKAMKGLKRINQEGVETSKAFASTLEDIFFELGERLSQSISGSITNSLSDLGDNLGQALVSGGNLLSVGAASLINSFGSFLSDIGKLLIEYGTLAVAKGTLDTAIATLFGPALIGAGLAAIGVGVALSLAGGAFKSVGQKGLSAQGVQGSVSGSGSFSGANNFSGGGGGFGGGEVVFRIQGQTLIGVLNNTLNSNARLGGSTTIG